MPATAQDAMLARLQAEVEERKMFMDGLVEAAQEGGRDLNAEEMELYTRARDRLRVLEGQLEPLREGARIALTSSHRAAELQEQYAIARNPDLIPSKVEYRSVGAYALDLWRSGLGQQEARQRVEMFNRAAAHQTTADNPGLLPEQILGPVINYIDASRPVVNALGPRQLPSGSWARPRITQHTSVGAQTGEKTELVSQKMVVGKIPVSATTLGGYVNISRQDVDWTQPSIMDLVINDLAAQYSKDTEVSTCGDITAAAPAGPTLPTGTPTAADVAGALWGAAASILFAVGGAGRIIAFAPPAMMGILGPLFPPVNPTNAISEGFSTTSLASGLAGSIAGIPIYVTNGASANTIIVMSTAAAEVYEDRVGALQVVEPSVLGVQVAYAGYFATLVIEPQGLSKIVKTP